ncbi:hypothetical protein EV424DRAFT_1542578 [Suillus variegatus]|nr:hypothetical protein EV424DRAFT_1542578 [Suillus variegatus]
MSKHVGSGGDEPPSKRQCTIDVQANQAVVPPALLDNGAWEILSKFLTMSMSLSEVDDAHMSYLDDAKSLKNFTELRKTYIPDLPAKSSVHVSASRTNNYLSRSHTRKSHKLSKAASMFIADKADVGDDEEEEEEEEYDGEDADGPSMQSPMNFPVTVSAWSAGQLYVVADSPAMIAKSLPLSLYLAVKEYSRIAKEEHEAVEHTQSEFPHEAWVRIKGMGWKYKGESYYMGLLLKSFHRNRLKLVVSPHIDDICLHLDSGWNKPFMNETVVAFSMQFLRVGDWVRVIKGSLCREFGPVISTDPTLGTVSLESALDGHLKEIEVRLKDIERVFRVGDTVKVVAGSYLGLEGHIIQICSDTFHLCQHATNEQVEVLRYYLDRRPLNHTVQSHFPAQQHFEPQELDSIQIGDFIEVLEGEHMGKRGVVDWFSQGDNKLWFWDIFNMESIESSGGLSSLSVPESGYDVRPGDIVTVICGPEYEAKGVVQSVDFPNAHLSVLCDGNHTVIIVPIGFVMKVRNVALDSFKKDLSQEVFIIGGDRKGYRVTLYSLSIETCTIAIHGQKRITVNLCDVVTKYGMRLSGAMLEGPDATPPFENVSSGSSTSITEPPLPSPSSVWSTWSASLGDADVAQDPLLSVNPISSTSDPAWTVDKLDTQDSVDAGAEKLSDSGPLAWLMSREFCSMFLTHHAMLKVSLIFDASLSKRFVSTACPDPFCGENGPAPNGCIAAYCTSNNAGAKIKYYHIPTMYLSPAPPRKKNQKCLILDGVHRGQSHMTAVPPPNMQRDNPCKQCARKGYQCIGCPGQSCDACRARHVKCEFSTTLPRGKKAKATETATPAPTAGPSHSSGRKATSDCATIESKGEGAAPRARPGPGKGKRKATDVELDEDLDLDEIDEELEREFAIWGAKYQQVEGIMKEMKLEMDRVGVLMAKRRWIRK